MSFVFGLALSRIIYEGFFPRALWLGRPLAALTFGFIGAILGWWLWRYLCRKLGESSGGPEEDEAGSLSVNHAAWTAAAVFLPLALNLLYLFNRSVDLTTSRFIFFSTTWLATLFVARQLVRPKTWRWLSFILLIGYIFPVYLATLGRTVGSADTFEFQVVVPRLGIAHPTGYPLYLLLSKPFTLLPFNSMAWRVNLATAVFGLAAVCLLYLLGRQLTKWSLAALVTAALFGLSPTFWFQAIQAEVYTLHALLVIAALTLMREVGGWRLEANLYPPPKASQPDEKDELQENKEPAISKKWHPYTWSVLLAFVLGLGLTNHLTTIILLPAAVLTILFAYRAGRFDGAPVSRPWSFILPIAAFLAPLLLYAYLPLRWEAVNGQPMGFDRFLDWVIGGRFQGALQLTAWLNDPARYDIVSRLLADEWFTFWTMLLILIGAAYLLLWQWRFGLILLLTWLGTIFYALNYYVPDLAVFIIPAQIIMAIWWLCGIIAALDLVGAKSGKKSSLLVQSIFLLAGSIPLLAMAAEQTLNSVNQIQAEDRTRWAESVLVLNLDEEGAILADSDKFPGLYYLQQAEGYRPDLDILLLPDEASYRAELDARLAAGQSVYLARFLPGLESIYHLNSFGPLIEVNTKPGSSLPPGVKASDLVFGPVHLLGYDLSLQSPYAEGESTVTFYWQSDEPLEDVLRVYTRWTSDDFESPASSQHPANNMYPTLAWSAAEVVADFHAIPQPMWDQPLALQAALGPPFSDPESLDWQNITVVGYRPATELASVTSLPTQLRIQVGSTALDAVTFPDRIRPQDPIDLQIAGHAEGAEKLSIALLPVGTPLPYALASAGASASVSQLDWQIVNPVAILDSPGSEPPSRTVWLTSLDAALPVGSFDLVVGRPGTQAYCGWFSWAAAGCVLGQVEISGITVPDGAINFEDKIGLLTVEIADPLLLPGGQLAVDLSWLSLAPLTEDFTVFVQVLDENDRIVGQVDSWPVQGTYPTSQWQQGEVIEDPYLIQLEDDLSSGTYKLNIGLYLLETLRRLPIIDDSGTAVDDKWEVPGLVVEP